VFNVLPARPAENKKLGDWNSIRITCSGLKIMVEQNGKILLNASLDDNKQKFDGTASLRRERGHIGLQGFNGRVEFRNLYVKELK
jgi:hypothetical protein